MTTPLKYKRLLLKLSGEALMGKGQYGIDMSVCDRLAKDIAEAVKAGAEIAVVVGGGNIFRGLTGAAKGMDRATGDYMGMLATVMNALAFQNALEHLKTPARVLSAIPMPTVCEAYVRPKALHHMDKGRVVIFGAGSGMPFFSTDTVSAQRALEVHADVLLMAKQGTDGVYDSDPRTNPDAKRYDELTYDEFLAADLKVADATAVSLARDYALPMIFFDLGVTGNIARVVAGEKIGTTLHA